jgi:hypothetical protein
MHQSPPTGSIRVNYEDQEGHPFEELTADNTLKLFSKRELKLVIRGQMDSFGSGCFLDLLVVSCPVGTNCEACTFVVCGLETG